MRVDSLRIRRGGSAALTLDGGRLTLTAHFLAISATVGAFSMSRSDLEIDESVEGPEAVDACSILLSDSLLSG